MPEPAAPTGAARLLRFFRVDPSEAGLYACIVGPLFAGVLLNGVIRPAIGHALGGIRHSPGSGVRSRDVFWEFDTATQAAHPFLTWFLETSDGAVAMCMLGLIPLLLLGRWVRRRRRSRAHDGTVAAG